MALFFFARDDFFGLATEAAVAVAGAFLAEDFLAGLEVLVEGTEAAASDPSVPEGSEIDSIVEDCVDERDFSHR